MMSQKGRKKRGRPPKADPGARDKLDTERGVRRSLRSRNVKYVLELDDYFDDDDLFENERDHRCKLKKLKLLLELQSSTPPEPKWSRCVDHEPTTSASNGGKPSKKRKINNKIDFRNDNVSGGDEEEDLEVGERKVEPIGENSPPGTLAEAPSGLPLPDKNDLELILNKLQKKDIYGVYAEPVDPEELPDYHDMIKHPMDFATVRNKLRNGFYETMEHFEHDVFLICSNAMQYNEPHTIYHKQARSIKAMAIKKFHKLRSKAECSVKDVQQDQRMRPSNVNLFVEGNFILNGNLDMDESLSVNGQLSRFGMKSVIPDENHHATCNPSLASPKSMFEAESKQLVPVGLRSDFSYARSLARFAATLGSVAWEFTSKRIEQALPQGLKFGRGWVGEYEPLPTPVLILEKCTVKEPPPFASGYRKLMNVPVAAFSSRKSRGTRPVCGNELPYLVPAAIASPDTSIRPSLAVEDTISRNVSEKQSFFLSPGIMPHGSASLCNQHEKSTSRACVGSIENIFKQYESTGPPPFHKQAIEPNWHGQISRDLEMEASESMAFASRNINFSPSETSKQHNYYGVKASSYRSQEQGQGLSDPVQLMRMLAEKGQNRQISLMDSSQALSSVPTAFSNDSYLAALYAAPTWMSVGPGGFGPTNQMKNNVCSDSQCNSTHGSQPQVAQIRGDLLYYGGMHVRPEGIGSTFHAHAPQGLVAARDGNEIQFHYQPTVYPHPASADLSRFQLQPTWWNLRPMMNTNSQSSVSPGAASGILSDLAQQYRKFI